MNLAIASATVLFALLLLACRGTTQAEELVGEQLRLTGQWTEERFKATRVRLWETKEAPQRGRVAGEIDAVNADTRTLRIGPILVEWWDEDLDAVRLHYDRRRLHAELSVAQE